LRIASAANIANQKRKILNPFDNFGSFIMKNRYFDLTVAKLYRIPSGHIKI